MVTNGRGQKRSNYCEEAWHKSLSSCRNHGQQKMVDQIHALQYLKSAVWASEDRTVLPTTFSHLDAHHTSDRLSPPEDMQNSIVFQGSFSYKFLLTTSYSQLESHFCMLCYHSVLDKAWAKLGQMTSFICKQMIAFASYTTWLGESLGTEKFLLVLNYTDFDHVECILRM